MKIHCEGIYKSQPAEFRLELHDIQMRADWMQAYVDLSIYQRLHLQSKRDGHVFITQAQVLTHYFTSRPKKPFFIVDGQPHTHYLSFLEHAANAVDEKIPANIQQALQATLARHCNYASTSK